jgi:hypothetical protein
MFGSYGDGRHQDVIHGSRKFLRMEVEDTRMNIVADTFQKISIDNDSHEIRPWGSSEGSILMKALGIDNRLVGTISIVSLSTQHNAT